MDLSNPQTWVDGIKVVVGAPHIVVPILIAVAIAVWWFRGKIEKSKHEGLKAQNDALEAHREYTETRLVDTTEQLNDAKAQLETLRSQIQSGVPQQQLTATANSTASALDFAIGANTELRKTVAAAPWIHAAHRKNLAAALLRAAPKDENERLSSVLPSE